MRLDVAVAVRARDREIPKNLAREDVRRPVEAADEGVARGLRFFVVAVCSRPDGTMTYLSYSPTPGASLDAVDATRRNTPSPRFHDADAYGHAAVRPLGPS